MKDIIKLFGNVDDISTWLKGYLNEHFRASQHTFFFDGIYHDVKKVVKIIPSENAFVVFKFTHTKYKLAKNGSHLPVTKGHIIFDYVTIQLFKLNNKSTELSFDIDDTDSEFLNPIEISKLKDELLARWGSPTTEDATDGLGNSKANGRNFQSGRPKEYQEFVRRLKNGENECEVEEAFLKVFREKLPNGDEVSAWRRVRRQA